MKVREIYEKLKAGEIELVFNGHQTNATKESVIERYEEDLALSLGSNDGKWKREPSDTETVEEIDAGMRKSYESDLNRDLNFGDEFPKLRDNYCFCCGRNLSLMYVEKGIAVDGEYRRNIGRFGEWVSTPCDFDTQVKQSVKITIEKKMVFANWMPTLKDDCPKELQYKREYELNNSLGRFNRMKWKAENQNVAYTQTGSYGSAGIYINKEKDRVIIGSRWMIDDGEEENQEDIKEYLKGFKMVGHTEIAVWRVEATDSKNLNLSACKRKWDEINHDYVIADVQKGTWEMTSYYENFHPLGECVFAELNLIK